MMLNIPGRDALDIRYLVFDYNGTLAEDGKISDAVCTRLQQLSQQFQLYVLTADTYGTAAEHCHSLGLPLIIKTFPSGAAADRKAALVTELGPQHCACFGNGFNDQKMLAIATLAIGVLGTEGMSPAILQYTNYLVSDICHGLDLFLNPQRLIAGLRH